MGQSYKSYHTQQTSGLNSETQNFEHVITDSKVTILNFL